MSFLGEMRKKFALDLPVTEAEGKKRDKDTFLEPAAENVHDCAAFPLPFCYEAQCQAGEKHVALLICPANRIFIVNRSKSPVLLTMAGWYKGKWHVVRNPIDGSNIPADHPLPIQE